MPCLQTSLLLELPLALQLRVAGYLDVHSLCSLGQCSRRTLELVCEHCSWLHAGS